MCTLSAWAGQPRWANDRFALFDLPDIEVGSEGAAHIEQAPPGRNCGLRIANCGIKEIRNPRLRFLRRSEIRNSSPPLWSLDAHWQAIEGLPDEARRWMPEQAEVWLWLPDALENTSLRMDAQSFNGQRTLSISLNSVESSFPLEVWQGAIDQRTLIETPPLTFKKGHNRITLSLQEGCQRPTDIDPQATDGRCLGLLVHHLWLARP
ncbi:MAG: hypothetical protein ACPGWR_20235 [Ardenticatenaceae bacterium]